MDKDKLGINLNDPEATPGIIVKTASVSPLEVTEADLKQINKYTLSPVTAERYLSLRLRSRITNRTTGITCLLILKQSRI